MARFERCVGAEATPCEVRLLDRQVEMTVRAADRHFWSPHLKLLVDAEHDHTTVRGRFGPNVNVWTMFLAANTVLFLVGTVGLFIGTSQLQIGQSPVGLWLSAGCLVGAALVWAAGKLGQRWAHDQMVLIHRFVHDLFEDVIDDDIHCEACDDDPDAAPGAWRTRSG